MIRFGDHTSSLLAVLTVIIITVAATPVAAQSLGTFRWQLRPYCHVLTLAVTQNGAGYRVEGTDDQCGGVQASVIGTAFPNPDGSIGFGLNIVAAPGGAPVHVDATIDIASLGGSWRDSAGNSGSFVLTPGAAAGGTPRPLAGPIGAAGVNASQVQLRVTGTCPAGQLIQRINEDGSVMCEAAGSATALNALQLGGVPADQYVRTTDSRLTDARVPLPGSSHYVANSSTVQSGASFNVGGTGTAAVFNAMADFTIAGQRVLSKPGTNNIFVGQSTGLSNTTGFNNTFVGESAGFLNSAGTGNTFFGRHAGRNNTTGAANVLVGNGAGVNNGTGNSNAFFGSGAGAANASGGGNSFFGATAGDTNVSGSNNTAIGTGADVTAGDLTHATAIGAFATVSTSNSIVLSRSTGQDTVRIPGRLDIAGAFGADVINAGTQYSIGGARVLSTPSNLNTFVGVGSGAVNTGGANTFLGHDAGLRNSTGSSNVFIGHNAGFASTTGSGNVFIGANSGNNDIPVQVDNSVAIKGSVTTSNTIVLGSAGHTTRIPGSFAVSDVGFGNFGLEVVNSAIGGGVVARNLYIRQLNQAGSPAHLCWKVAPDGVQALLVTTCTSSLASARLKTDVEPLTDSLDLISRLRPVAFTWTDAGTRDVGLNAEDVSAIDPNLVTRNENGEVEDVKEGRLTVVLINAIKEQQAQITTLWQQIEELKALVCQTNRGSEDGRLVCVQR
jgi:Chaperone of endosialidase